MRRTRARVVAATVVAGVTVGTAYADLVATPTIAQSEVIPASVPGDVVFSLRNNSAGSLMITGFTTMAPNGSSGDIDACATLTISPTSVTLGAGQQQQFRVDTAGYATSGRYACIYQPTTNPAMAPLPQITALFQVFPAPPNGNVQPTMMDFGMQGSSSFESQTLFFTNYAQPTMQTQLSITNDPTNTIVFGSPCDGMQSCFIGGLATNATGTIPLKCIGANRGNPSATVNVMGTGSGGSGFIGSMQATCTTQGSGSLSMPSTILLSGPANQQTTPVAVMVDRFGTGSAVLTTATMMGDPSLGIVECNGASCSNLSETFPATLNVYCTPQAGGASGTLFVMDDNGESTSATVDCNVGSGGGPLMTVSPSFINFAGTTVNASVMSMITIGNPGGAQLDGVEVAVGGIDPGDFSVSACDVGNPCSIGSNSILDVTVTFTPQAVGARSGLLTVTNTNDLADSGQTVTLNGSGAGATMSVLSPAGNDLDFHTIPRGQPVTMPITIGDMGNVPITATITGVSPPYTVDTGTITVPAGGPGSNSFQITCQSTTASGSNDQTFTITSPDAYSGSPQTVTVHCAVASSQLAVDPNPIHFLEHRVGSPEATIDVTLTNPGSAAPASIQHVQLASAKTGLSLSPPDTTLTLAAGSSAHVTLDLKTTTETDLAGEKLNINVDGELLQVAVDGKVVTPASQIAPGSLDLGTACVGTQVSGTVSLINTGTATLNLADAPTMDQNFTASFVMPSTYPSTLAPGATAVTTVSPAMSASGMVTGTLEWKDDVPNDYHVPVALDYVSNGTAISPAALDFGSIEVGTPGSSQQITIQNCDAVPAQVKVRSLRATSGPIGAWTISPMIGNSAQLGAKGIETVTAHFDPPGRGRYEAELSLDTPNGIKVIKLLGDATGRDLDDTSVYACSCSGGSTGGGWPIGFALLVVITRGRRRRGSSSPR